MAPRAAPFLVLAACLPEYRLVPLRCADGAEGALYDLRFEEGGDLVLRADVLCLSADDDPHVQARVADGSRVGLALTGCERRPSDEERGRFDLLGCEVRSAFGLGATPECLPAEPSGSTLRLVVDAGADALDEVFVPVNVSVLDAAR